MEKIHIEGIKLSNELVHFAVRTSSHSMGTLSALFQTMTKHRINLPYLTTSSRDGIALVFFCVEIKDEARARGIVNTAPDLEKAVVIHPSVGLLSVFPHKNRMKIFGLSLHALAKTHIPLYGWTSSLSALTFVAGYHQLNEAAASLEKFLTLPPRQRPIKTKIQIRQSRRMKEPKTNKNEKP